MVIHPFSPVYNEESLLLILGSFPSVKSRETGFYYGHPQNRFWRVLARVFGCPVPESIEEKKQMLLSHRVAVWDVLKSCEITGSADATIKSPIPNDIGLLLKQTAIRSIVCNGGKSYRLFQQWITVPPEIIVQKLPSTSPANAQFSLDRLCKAWSGCLDDLCSAAHRSAAADDGSAPHVPNDTNP